MHCVLLGMHQIVISGHIQDESFEASSMWTNKYLAESAVSDAVSKSMGDSKMYE